MTPRHLSVVGLAFSLIACGAAPSKPIAPAETPAPASRPIEEASPAPIPAEAPAKARAARLRFELGGREFPSPLVDAVIDGQPATMIVDTGASHHVVAAWLAAEVSAPLVSAGDSAVDHAGKKLDVKRMEKATLSISGWGAIEANGLLVVNVPDAMRRAGIGGVLSPQALVTDKSAVVLDLAKRTMQEKAFDSAIAELAGKDDPPPVKVTTCGKPNQGTRTLVKVLVEGLPADLEVDTGATQTSLRASSAAAARLKGKKTRENKAYAASGAETVSAAIDVHLGVGSFDTMVDVDLVPSAATDACSGEGFLGMDVLASCKVVLGKDGGALACTRR